MCNRGSGFTYRRMNPASRSQEGSHGKISFVADSAPSLLARRHPGTYSLPHTLAVLAPVQASRVRRRRNICVRPCSVLVAGENCGREPGGKVTPRALWSLGAPERLEIGRHRMKRFKRNDLHPPLTIGQNDLH